MGRIAAIGGGTFEDTDGLVRRICDLSKKEKPNVLFIGTAAEDSTNPLTSFKKSVKRVCPGVIVKKLSVIRSVYTEEEMDELLSWADIIYVGPGNTEFMLEKWAEFGLPEKLRKIFLNDSAVLSGTSAGAICWFSVGYTDSEFFTGNADWTYKMIRPGFDLIPLVFCPHYGDYKRHGFDEALDGIPMDGVALEDGTALFYEDGKISFASSVPGAKAYYFRQENGKHRKEEVTFHKCFTDITKM